MHVRVRAVPCPVDLGPGRLRDGRRAARRGPAGRRRPDALLGHGRRPRRRRRREAHAGGHLVEDVSEMNGGHFTGGGLDEAQCEIPS